MKKFLAIALSLTLIFYLTACTGGSDTGSNTTASDSSVSSEASSKVSSAASSEASSALESQPADTAGDDLPQGTGTTLVVYSNSVSDGRGDWLVERAAKDGYVIEYVDAGAAAVQSRLIAEKNAPIADVVFGLNAIIWESLKAEDILIPYTPSWADEVSEGLNDPDGYYHAIVKQAILLVYNKNFVSEADAPTDWLDLWNNEKFYGTYECMNKLEGGTTRNVIAGVLTRYADPAGDLGISEEGWEQMKLYYEHGVLAEEEVDLYAKFADPDSTVVSGQMWSSGIAARDEEYGVDTGIVIPSVGVPYAVEGVSIVKGTKNEEEAQNFIEWFGSAQVQGEWAEEFSTLPANEKALEHANEFNQYIATLPAQDIDWGLVAENIDAWCEKIQLTYMP